MAILEFMETDETIEEGCKIRGVRWRIGFRYDCEGIIKCERDRIFLELGLMQELF